MRFDLARPCRDCPFLRQRQFPLTRGRAQEIVRSILHDDKTFPCHKTLDYSAGEPDGDGPDVQHCAGALILNEHCGRPNWRIRFAALLGMFDPGLLRGHDTVYADEAEMLGATHWSDR